MHLKVKHEDDGDRTVEIGRYESSLNSEEEEITGSCPNGSPGVEMNGPIEK